jgi:hypothetical protein
MRYFLIEFLIYSEVYTGVASMTTAAARIKRLRFIQAQTENEAIAKFKLTLKASEKYLEHKNLTIS